MKKLSIGQHQIIGMIHLPATLSYQDWPGVKKFISKAKDDLLALQNGGANAALIENDADHPCQVKGHADVVTPMTIVAYELSKVATIPLGIEVLLNDPIASLAIAKTCGLSFIRTDYFVDQMTRNGYGGFEIDPTKIIEYRHKIKANNIKIYTDVQVKYATMVDKNKSVATSITQAIAAGSDGIIITGTKTGIKPLAADIQAAQNIVPKHIPLIIGSGFSVDNATELLKYANWAIVGTSLKTGYNIDINKVKSLMKKIV